MSDPIPVPARMHILFSPGSPQAVIIRRGPSKQTAVIGWDRSDDTFVLGQWLKGHIYPYRSDVSPDGKHWIYFARGKKGQTWTAVAKVPYLKALDFYTKPDSYNGGGLFVSHKEYWLNEGDISNHRLERKKKSGLKMTRCFPGNVNTNGECTTVYFPRLKRDGWRFRHDLSRCMGLCQRLYFCKTLNDFWTLLKFFHMDLNDNLAVGKGVFYEKHALLHRKTKEEIMLPDWEWADLDGSRVVWAQAGKILAGTVDEGGLCQEKEVFDANPMVFSARTAPY